MGVPVSDQIAQPGPVWASVPFLFWTSEPIHHLDFATTASVKFLKPDPGNILEIVLSGDVSPKAGVIVGEVVNQLRVLHPTGVHLNQILSHVGDLVISVHRGSGEVNEGKIKWLVPSPSQRVDLEGADPIFLLATLERKKKKIEKREKKKD